VPWRSGPKQGWLLTTLSAGFLGVAGGESFPVQLRSYDGPAEMPEFRQYQREKPKGLINSSGPPLSHEDQSLSRLPPREGGGVLNDAFAGLQRVPDSKTRATGLRGPLQKRNFLAGLPSDLPTSRYVSTRPLLDQLTDAGLDRRFYELCVLVELKNALRSGDIKI
jgi:hypothetical protein